MLRKISGYDNAHICATCRHWEGCRKFDKFKVSDGVEYDTDEEARCDIGGTTTSYMGMMRADHFCRKWSFFGDYI